MSLVESELKLRIAGPGQVEAILKWPLVKNLALGLPREEFLETTYYDTSDYSLSKSRLSYRIRNNRTGLTATVKADGLNSGGLHQRLEFNLPLAKPEPDIEPFFQTGIGGRLKDALGKKELLPIFTTSFSRRIMDLKTPDGSEIELALDCGQIIFGNKNEPILELELELKTGSCQALVSLGAEISQQFPLLIELDSKLARALALANLSGHFAKDRKKTYPIICGLEKEPALPNIYRILIHLVQNVIDKQHAFLLNPDSALALHRLRINLRRLHTIFSFSKPLMPAKDYKKWKSFLKDFQLELGLVRDWDAIIEGWQGMFASSGAMSNQISESPHPLIALLEDNRRTASLKLSKNFLAKGQTTPLLLGLWAWLEKELNQIERRREPGPALSGFVQKRCRALIKEFISFGDKIGTTGFSSQFVFKLRILNRKIRYILHGLAPVLNCHTAELVECLKKLQDNLGAIRDAELTVFNITRLLNPSDSWQMHYDAGLIIGWQSCRSLKAKNDFPQLWRKTKKTALNWLVE